ncbi:MAG: indolepyruvate ferredoxin oxidoreductase family protein, partial [Pseudomonadales bacterium]
MTRAAPGARLGIVASGKAYQDLSQALRAMGIGDASLGSLGMRVLKVGMVWPLDDTIVREFADGLDTILVVEEKRPLLEDQIRSILYGQPNAPAVVGKFFDGQAYATNRGEAAFPNAGEITPALIARVLSRAAMKVDPSCGVAQPNFPEKPAGGGVVPMRAPSFCAGCPHGRSTQVIDGSRALAGIGCHGMAIMADPTKTNTISHMGGEGVMWIGQQPFTNEKHVFANMGDGTYFHSGFMAIRAAVAARVPITYKLLVNGFVSMTGGQPIEGELSIEQIVGELTAEGVGRIVLVSDEPEKHTGARFPATVTVHPRTQMVQVQRELREYPNVSVLIYEQPCATERRRLRKRGKWADPDKRVYIHPLVCEGCGDCGTVSNCMAIEPLETLFGRKRQINQSSCNKDFSCLEGFCPSLVTVEGARPKKRDVERVLPDTSNIPVPELPAIDSSWAVLVAGIGGTGVVTIGQTLAVAAHADGLFSSNLDVTGLAQKYGAVLSHVKMAGDAKQLTSTRIATGEADTLIGADIIVSAGDEVLSTLVPGKSGAIVSTHLTPTAEFSRNPDWKIDETLLVKRLSGAVEGQLLTLDAIALAEKVLGDAVFANTLLLGAAWQRGGIPVSHQAMMRALELNGVAVDTNRAAFELGRLAAHDPAQAERLLGIHDEPANAAEESLDAVIERRAAFLVDYQDETLANRYRELVARVRTAEQALGAGDALARQVAQSWFRLLAHKDEWEVARLYSDPAFLQQLKDTFDGDLRLRFHLGAWPLGRREPGADRVTKRELGGWILPVFRVMNRLRGLRGTLLDPFRNGAEAKAARAAVRQYEDDVALILKHLTADKLDAATRLAAIPEQVKGYGHIRQRAADKAIDARRDAMGALLGDSVDAPRLIAS